MAELPSYEWTVAHLFTATRALSEKWSWDDVVHLMEVFGNPHLSFRTVHIAGTNGKGSVSIKVAAALQTQGYKTGLFISPHIRDFRERIQVDSQCVSEAFVVRTAHAVVTKMQELGTSFTSSK